MTKEYVRKCAKRQRVRRRAFVDYRKNKPCADCLGTFPPYVMHFDHRVPSNKTDGISALVIAGRTIKDIDAEISKCDVVCANCHAERTHIQRVNREF